ncbi:MAG: ACT domain-containing protein [Anaerolineales bacterium]
MLDALGCIDYRNVLNLPFIVGLEYGKARPYLDLAEKVGALQGQLAEGRVLEIEVELKGEGMTELVKPITVALLKGLLDLTLSEPVNYVNAPTVAAERGIVVSQTRGMSLADYPNLLSCRVHWEGGQRLIAGVIFGGSLGRIVQIDGFQMDALPQGRVLIILSRDVPGVIGEVGTLLSAHNVNIAEWRLGRDRPGGAALSFVNLDQPVTSTQLEELKQLPQVTEAKLVRL